MTAPWRACLLLAGIGAALLVSGCTQQGQGGVSSGQSFDPSALALQLQDLPGGQNWTLRERGERPIVTASEESKKAGLQYAYGVSFVRLQNILTDWTRIDQIIQIFPTKEGAQTMLSGVRSTIAEARETGAVVELSDPQIGEASVALKMKTDFTSKGESTGDWRTIIAFTKHNVYEEVSMAGVVQDQEVLKETAKKAASKITAHISLPQATVPTSVASPEATTAAVFTPTTVQSPSPSPVSSPSPTPAPTSKPSPLQIGVTSWNAVDDQGYPTMNVVLSSAAPTSLTVTLTNPDGNEVGRTKVTSGQTTVRLKMTGDDYSGSREVTPPPGNYKIRFLICKEEGIIGCSEEVDAAPPVIVSVKGARDANLYVQGVVPSISYCTTYQTPNTCTLSKLTVTLKNNGDVPAYITQPQLLIGGRDVTASVSSGAGTVLPGKTKAIGIRTFPTDLTFGVSHSYDLFLHDDAGNELLKYSAAIVAVAAGS